MDHSTDAFVKRALLSLASAQGGGPVYDGPAYARYLRDQVHCAVTGSEPSVPKPEPTKLTTVSTSNKTSG